ncbi:MAG: hypothetical protein AAFW87_00440 [Pseudomonadota bacterium]
MKLHILSAVIGTSMVLSACSQPQSTPQPIIAEPVLNKYDNEGGGGCPGGQTAGANGNCIPYDGYQQPNQTQTGTNIPQPRGGGNQGRQ